MVAAALTLVSVGGCVACLVYLHVAPTGYSPVRNANHGKPWLGWVMAALAIGTMLSLRTSLRPWFGLIERGYYAAMLAWLVLVSARLL